MIKKPSPKRQIELIIYAVITVTGLLYFGLTIWLRKLINIPAAFFYILLPFLMVAVLNATQTILEKSRYKDEIARWEKEIEEEEKKDEQNGKIEKPNIWQIGLFAACALVWAAVEGVGLVMDMIQEKSFIMFLPDTVCFFTLLAIGLVITKITYNVWKGKVFTESNSRLIYFMGFILVVSVLIQLHYWDSTEMVPNSTVGMYFMGFGALILFFGSLFDIAIKMKNDRDLTI